MENNKVLSALSYISIFFAPLIIPIIIFLVSKQQDVKHHAKRALLSHLIPTVIGILFFIGFIITTTSMTFTLNAGTTTQGDFTFVWFLAAFAIYLLISLGITIWNIVQAVKVMR
ncbi:MAG: DUF4870 domain-containing protein [Lysinibacillus sp.]